MPTFVAEYEATWNDATSPKTSSVTVAAGDALVVGALTEEGNSNTLTTPTGGTGVTWTLQQSIVLTSYTALYLWTALPSAQTFTLSVARTVGSGLWGFNCLRFSGVSGIGGSNKANATGAPSVAVTATGANSVIAAVIGDWNAADGASRAWLTAGSAATEQTYFRDPSTYTAYMAYYADTGAAGSKTVGLSAPTGLKYAIGAVELLGSAAAPANKFFLAT
jgi:hypothetical protein